MKSRTQKQKILGHLAVGKTISSAHAMVNWRIIRLSAIIFDLRNEGYPIKTRKKINSDGTGYFAVYYFEKDFLEKINKINFV